MTSSIPLTFTLGAHPQAVTRLAPGQLRHRYARIAQRSSGVAAPWSAACNVTATTAPVSRSTRVLGLVPGACARPSSSPPAHPRPQAFHPCSTCAFALAVQPRQILARRRRDAGSLRQPAQKLLAVLLLLRRAARSNAWPRWLPASSHRWQTRRPCSSPRSANTPSTQPNTSRCVQIDQPFLCEIKRVIRRVLIQPDAHKRRSASESASRQGNAALRPDALKASD